MLQNYKKYRAISNIKRGICTLQRKKAINSAKNYKTAAIFNSPNAKLLRFIKKTLYKFR